VLAREAVRFLGDPEANASLARLQGPSARGVCFELAVQRLRSWYFDHGFYRRKAWEFCGVPQDQPLDTILLEEHTGTRAWAERESLAEFIAAHKIARGLRVLLASFGKASFCDQVQIFARSKVAILHHGAGFANCAFLSPEAVCIEVEAWCPSENAQCLPFVHGTLSQQFFELTGIRYIGARVAIPVRIGGGKCPPDHRYFYERDCVVQVKNAGMDVVLQKALELGGPWPDGGASLGVVDHAAMWPAAYASLWPRSADESARVSASAAVAMPAAGEAPNLGSGPMRLAPVPGSGSWGELLLVPAVSCAGLIIGLWHVGQRARSSARSGA